MVKIESAEFAGYCDNCTQSLADVKMSNGVTIRIHDDGSLDKYWRAS